MTDIISKEIIKDINSFIEFQLQDKGIPCIAVTVVGRDDNGGGDNNCINLFKNIYHHKDIKTPIPTLDKTTFRVASVSKLFTYISLLVLLDRGLLSLDDPVIKYIPNFKPGNPKSYGFGDSGEDDEYPSDLYKNITIFNLIRHTSGLIREPIQGNYFADVQCDLETLVNAMNESTLVSEPGTQYKYSNAAVAVAGYIVQVVSGEVFEDFVENNVLKPLGMNSSTFKNINSETIVTDENKLRTAYGHMWRYWDEESYNDLSVYTEAPHTHFGMNPAGGLRATIDDLSKWIQFFLQHGKKLLKPTTFNQFFTQQPLDKPVECVNQSEPYQFDSSQSQNSGGTTHGLGIEINQMYSYLMGRHGGAINGFASDFRVLPELGLGVFTCCTLDCSNGVAQQVSEYIVNQLMAGPDSCFINKDKHVKTLSKNGGWDKTLQAVDRKIQFLNSTLTAQPIDDALYDNISGYWYLENETEQDSYNDANYLEIVKSYNGRVLCKNSTINGISQIVNPTTKAITIITSDRISCNQILLNIPANYEFKSSNESQLKAYSRLIRDTEDSKTNLTYFKYSTLPTISTRPPWSEEFKDLIGHYTARDQAAIIYEDNGCLMFNIEWLFQYKMKFLSATSQPGGDGVSKVYFLLSPNAMYNYEVIEITMVNGKPTILSLSGIPFKYQNLTTKGKTQPGVSSPEICKQILERSNFIQFPFGNNDSNHQLVDLESVSSTFKFDIKYATTDNFSGIKLYKQAKAFLNNQAAKSLLSAHNWLIENHNVGIVLLDTYRPWSITWVLAECCIPQFKGVYVADPSKGSIHNRGGAVDISLFDVATGETIEMVGDFDELSIRSHRSYIGGTQQQRYYRKLLSIAMMSNNFSPYPQEWWHYDFKSVNPLPVLNIQFDQIK